MAHCRSHSVLRCDKVFVDGVDLLGYIRQLASYSTRVLGGGAAAGGEGATAWTAAVTISGRPSNVTLTAGHGIIILGNTVGNTDWYLAMLALELTVLTVDPDFSFGVSFPAQADVDHDDNPNKEACTGFGTAVAEDGSTMSAVVRYDGSVAPARLLVTGTHTAAVAKTNFTLPLVIFGGALCSTTDIAIALTASGNTASIGTVTAAQEVLLTDTVIGTTNLAVTDNGAAGTLTKGTPSNTTNSTQYGLLCCTDGYILPMSPTGTDDLLYQPSSGTDYVARLLTVHQRASGGATNFTSLTRTGLSGAYGATTTGYYAALEDTDYYVVCLTVSVDTVVADAPGEFYFTLPGSLTALGDVVYGAGGDYTRKQPWVVTRRDSTLVQCRSVGDIDPLSATLRFIIFFNRTAA